MICCWFVVGLMEEELVEEGRACILVFGERKGQSIVKEFWGKKMYSIVKEKAKH